MSAFFFNLRVISIALGKWATGLQSQCEIATAPLEEQECYIKFWRTKLLRGLSTDAILVDWCNKFEMRYALKLTRFVKVVLQITEVNGDVR